MNGSIVSKKSESDLFVYLFYYDILIYFMHNLKAYRLQIFSANFLFKSPLQHRVTPAPQSEIRLSC